MCFVGKNIFQNPKTKTKIDIYLNHLIMIKNMKKGKDYIGVGVGAVITNARNEILLLLRKKSPELGYWTIPGGSVEFGENIEDAIIREVKEELGVDCQVVQLLRVTNHIVNAENTHWVSPAFLVKIIYGTPRNVEPDKSSNMQWFPLGSLPLNLTLTTILAVQSYNKLSKENE
jgi:8-oxo-dGTP diphosphatase